MMHHYGRCFPRIYSSPIQPLKPRTLSNNERSYLDFIRDDLEDNLSLNTLPNNKSSDSSGTAAANDKQTQTDFDETKQQQTHCSSRSTVAHLARDKQTQTNCLEGLNLQMRFTAEEDTRILRAMKTLGYEKNSSQKNWNKIKTTAYLSQDNDQIKSRVKEIERKRNRNAQKPDTLNSMSLEKLQQFQQYEIVPRLLNSVKIDRIATALNNATQREYFDYTFFENLPAKIGTQERTDDLKWFYQTNSSKIYPKLYKTTIERLLLHEDHDLDKKFTLLRLVLYDSQRKNREKMRQNSQMLSSANTIITESKGCKRPNDSRELGPKYKCSRLSGPVSCISLNSEWKSLLSFLSHKDVNTLLNETRFWDNVSRKIEVSTNKTGNEFKKEFYTKIIPTRNDENWIALPKLNLKPDTPNSKLIIFHEINKTGLIYDSIEQLISDELLSDKFSLETWFEKFALEVMNKDHKFFMANECEFEVLKELVRVNLVEKAFSAK